MTKHTPTSDTTSQEWSLRDISRILTKRRFMIINITVIVTVIQVVVALSLTPIYRSTCKISIERKSARILESDVMSLESGPQGYESFYNTQYEILRTQAIQERVIERLRFEERPRYSPDGELFQPTIATSIKNRVTEFVTRKEKERSSPRKVYLKWLDDGLTVSPQRLTQLVDIHFDSVDPDVSSEIANALADSYIDFSLEKKLDIARQSESFISDRIFELRKEIAEGERQLQDYARRHGIVTGDDRDVARQHLASLQASYTSSLGETAARKAAFISARTADPNSLQEVRTNPLVAELNRRTARKEEEHSAALQTFGEAYPELQKRSQALNDIRRALDEHVERIAGQVVESRSEAYREAQARTEELATLVAEATSRVDDLEQAMIEYEQHRFGLDRKKATLQNLLGRRNDMLLAASMGEDTAHNVRVINRAEPAEDVHSPKKKQMVAVGLLFGLFLGIGGAILLETLDDTLRSPEDVAEALGLLVAGEIPNVDQVNGNGRLSRARRSGKRTVDPALVTLRQPRGPAAEAFRELRTSVLSADDGDPLRTILVTSSEPSEGKTTTAINLAVALGQLGRTVLVIDTDLRRPNCHRTLGLRPEKGGVSTYLKRRDVPIEALVISTDLPNVSLLPSGPVPPDPAELIDSSAFKSLLEDVCKTLALETERPFDHIIFDTPPVLSVVDPILVGRHVDSCLLVLRSGYVRRRSARAALAKMHVAKVRVAGAVLNALQIQDGSYGYRYYRYYRRDDKDDARRVPRHPATEHSGERRTERERGGSRGRSKTG